MSKAALVRINLYPEIGYSLFGDEADDESAGAVTPPIQRCERLDQIEERVPNQMFLSPHLWY
jgi:hypothetical protein